MNHWPFIAAAYAVVLGGTGLLAVVSHAAMRQAERTAEPLGRRP